MTKTTFGKAAGGSLALLLLLTSLSFAQARRNAPAPAAETHEDSRAAVAKVIGDYVKAIGEFSTHKDVEKVLRFYTTDYSEIGDGRERDLEQVRADLERQKEQLDLGSPVRTTASLTRPAQIRTSGQIAYAVFGYVLKQGEGGRVTNQQEGVCTTVLTKQQDNWLISHEHCSARRD